MLLPPPLVPASAAAAPIIAHDAPRLARRAPKTTIAFVDLETTGLDPSRHDIIEIGIVETTPDGSTRTYWSKLDNVNILLGGLSRLMHKLNIHMDARG